MLTVAGKNHIRRYLAQYVPAIAGAMAFGVGSRAAAGGDFALQFETHRAEINSIVYDFATNKLIYKATLPADFSGVINEIGLYTLYEDSKAGSAGSKVLTDINEGEGWVQTGTSTASAFYVDADPDLNRTFPRLGISGLRQTPATSGTRNDSLTNLVLDLSPYSGSDFITVAANIVNNNTASMTVRFQTDNSNYYYFNLPSVTAGYKVVEFLKSGASVTGTPDWSNITEIQLITVSNGSGASDVLWDGIGLVDTDTANLDYTLVARKVLASPKVIAANQSQEIEFTLDVTL